MPYFLGVDVGGSKTHALAADQNGKSLGFASAGPGNWESVGYDGLTAVLQDVTTRALKMACISIKQIDGSGMGLAGFDWDSQKQLHLDAIAPLGLCSTPVIVNDAILGIAAGSENGWGISIVAGTGCNCRGWNKDHTLEGRVVGGASHWSGEAAGGFDILARAMRAVAFEWSKRGPATALTPAFLKHTGAKDLDDLIEGSYLGRFGFDPSMILLVFEVARQGDAQALEVMRWAGQELGEMGISVIKQLGSQNDAIDVVLIGSIFDGHPLIRESLEKTIHVVAPAARSVRLDVPPVVGGVLLGMEASGLDTRSKRQHLVNTAKLFFNGTTGEE